MKKPSAGERLEYITGLLYDAATDIKAIAYENPEMPEEDRNEFRRAEITVDHLVEDLVRLRSVYSNQPRKPNSIARLIGIRAR